MISKLEIKGFKSLVDVSIELGAVNVFIGANGSGKSNLLEAVGFLSSILEGSLDAEPLRYRGVRDGIPNSFRTSFNDHAEDGISITATTEELVYSASFSPNKDYPSEWEIDQESLKFKSIDIISGNISKFEILGKERFFYRKRLAQKAKSKSLVKYIDMISLFLADDREAGLEQPFWRSPSEAELAMDRLGKFPYQIDEFAIFTPTTPQLRGLITDIHRKRLGLGGSGLGQAIDDMLKREPDKLGPFDLDDVYELIEWADSLTIDETNDQATRLRIGDRFMGNGHKTVSLLESSEGALYVLFLLALVGHADSPPIFAVDNFDQALHPRLARALTEMISDQILADGTRQMLATTHNPLVLDGLDLLDDRVRLFTVDRDKTGASQVQRVLVTEELIDQGFSLSRLWTSGRFGGVPRYL
jgi:predicted ATPase